MMTGSNIPLQRVGNQCLAKTTFDKPADVVKWMGVVQAQDFAGAKWALAQRMTGATEETIDAAFNAGEILRTHVLRPTWHFIAPDDIYSMLELSAPHVLAASAYWFKQTGLDNRAFLKANKAIEKALRDVDYLTRDELKAALEKVNINTAELRFGNLLIRAELDRIICSGPRAGKQFTYALLSKRAPEPKPFVRDEALASLTERYFASHGPATLKDYMWWSGLSNEDAKNGIALLSGKLKKTVYEGQEYWHAAEQSPVRAASSKIFLLPAYDEYTVAYQDRSLVLEAKYNQRAGNGIFKPVVVVNGKIAGTWSRTLKKNQVNVAVKMFAKTTEAQQRGMDKAIGRYAKFLGKKAG